MKTKPKTINGKIFEMVTISELAKALGRSTETIRKFEKRGILPRSNYRLPSTVRENGVRIEGVRLYTKQLADTLVDIFKGITQGRQITDEQKNLIREAFINEKTITNA